MALPSRTLPSRFDQAGGVEGVVAGIQMHCMCMIYIYMCVNTIHILGNCRYGVCIDSTPPPTPYPGKIRVIFQLSIRDKRMSIHRLKNKSALYKWNIYFTNAMLINY